MEKGWGLAKSAPNRHLHKVIQFENLNLIHCFSWDRSSDIYILSLLHTYSIQKTELASPFTLKYYSTIGFFVL